MESRKLSQPQSVYLDFLRATAAMVVLFGHCAIMFASGGFLEVMNFQSGGVVVFFLMSGFLISYSVFSRWKNPDYGFKEFFIDRFFRIYTAFLPALIFVFIIDHYFSIPLVETAMAQRPEMVDRISNMTENADLYTWIGNLFMMNSFPLFQVLKVAGLETPFFIDEYGSGSPFWTICIEWWIYIVFGMITLVFMRRPENLKKPLVLLVFGFALITPFYYLLGGPIDHLSFLWIFGMVAAYLFLNSTKLFSEKTKSLTISQKRLITLSVFGVSCICMVGRLMSVIEDRGTGHESAIYAELQFSIFLTIAIFSLLFFFGTYQKVPAAIAKFFKFFAGCSYSLYLTHMPIVQFLYLSNPGSDNSPKIFWIAIIVSNIVAIAFWWLFERHYVTLAKWAKAKFKKPVQI